MPQQSELAILITPNIPSPGEADRVLEPLLTFLKSSDLWGRGPLVWNLSEAELRDSELASALRTRLAAGDLFASAGYSKAPHVLLTSEELARELGTSSDSPEGNDATVRHSETSLRGLSRCAVIPPQCDTERREADVCYRALNVPLILGRKRTREGEQLMGYTRGILSTAPLVRIIPLPAGARPRRLRKRSRFILRAASHRGHYLVLHAILADEESVDHLVSLFRETEASASFRSRAVLAGLRLLHPAEPREEGGIAPLFTLAGDPLKPARLYRMLALRSSGESSSIDSDGSSSGISSTAETNIRSRLQGGVLESWLSVSKTRGTRTAKGKEYHSSRYQVVASMQGESSLSEGELELRCTEGAPTEIRIAGQTILHGVFPIARFSSGTQGIELEPRGVVSIESALARGLSARFAFPNDELATSRLSIRYLFFEGAPELFIELELDLAAPAGFAGRHSFTCLSFRPASGAETFATHPIQAQVQPLLSDSVPQHGIAASLRVEKGRSALGIHALAPVPNGASALLYKTDSQLSLGPSYGPADTACVAGLFDRRVLILSTTRPGRSVSSTVSTAIRSQLHDPICFMS